MGLDLYLRLITWSFKTCLFRRQKSAQVARQGIRKVLMIPREGYSSDMDLVIKMEVGEMKRVLKEAGFAVDIATTSGQPILGVTQYIYGVSKLSEINLSDYAGIIMPCMSVGRLPGPPVSPEVVLAVKNVSGRGKTCSGCKWFCNYSG